MQTHILRRLFILILLLSLFAKALPQINHGSIKGNGVELYAQYNAGVLDPSTKREGVELYFKAVTIGGKSWGWTKVTGAVVNNPAYSSQLRYWGGSNFGTKTENNLEIRVPGTQELYGYTVKTIPDPLEISIYQNLSGFGDSESIHFSYDINAKNSLDPTDLSPPEILACDVEAFEYEAILTLSGTDNSGDFFYHLRDEQNDIEEIIFTSAYTLSSLAPGVEYSLLITPVDFSGNEGTPLLKTFTTKALPEARYPESGKMYKIKHLASKEPNERYIGRNGEVGVIQTYTDDEQVFSFVHIDSEKEIYHLQQLSTGDFFAKDPGSGYMSKYTYDLTMQESKITIEQDPVGYFYLKCMAASGYLGTDNTDQNRSISLDKGKIENGRFIFEEVVPDDDQVKKAVNNILAVVKFTLSRQGNYGESEKEALRETYLQLESILANGTYPGSDELTDLLLEAYTRIDNYLKSEFTVRFDHVEDERYYIFITRRDGVRLYLTMNSNGNSMAGKEYGMYNNAPIRDNQIYLFEPVEGKRDTYFIKNANNGKAINANANLSDEGVGWKIEYYATIDGIHYFHFINPEEKYLYFYGNDMDYSMATGNYNTGPAYLIAIETEIGLVKGFLKEVLDEATLLYMTTRAGTQGGEYPEDVRNLLKAAIDEAKAMYENENAEKADVDYCRKNLEEIMEQYRNAVIVPVFTPEAGAWYRIRPHKAEYTKYISTIIRDGRMTAQDFAAGNTQQYWELVPVSTGETGVYLMKNAAGLLTYQPVENSTDFSLSAISEEDADETTQFVRFVYSMSDINTHFYCITTYDGNYAVSLHEGEYLIISAYDKTDPALPVEFIKVSTGNDIDKTALGEAIKEAEESLLLQPVGTGEGECSPEVYDAFVEVLNRAKDIYENENSTQAEVNAILDESRKAQEAFTEQVFVSLALFRELIRVAKSELDAAVVGEQMDEYYQSILDALDDALQQAYSILAMGYVTRPEMEALEEAVKIFRQARNRIIENIRNVLADAISSADSLHDRAVEGTDPGQYPAGSKAAFKSVINSARDVLNKTNPAAGSQELRAALDRLTAARRDFENGKSGVDLSALQQLIADAEEMLATYPKGDFNGQYPESAFQQLQQAVDDAKMIVDFVTANQDIVDNNAASLENAITNFEDSKIVIDFDVLESLIIKVRDYIANTVPGDNNELALAIEELKTVLQESEAINGSNSVSQRTVDEKAEEMNRLLNGMLDIIKFDLQEAVRKTNNYIRTTTTEDDEDLEEAMDRLKAALERAMAFLDNDEVMQDVFMEETTKLKQAMYEFLAILKAGLNDAITMAKNYSETTTAREGTALATALNVFNGFIDSAEKLAGSDEVTQELLRAEQVKLYRATVSFLTALTLDLRNAVEYALNYTETSSADNDPDLQAALDLLEKLVDEAFDLLASEDIVQADLNAKQEELEAALENLLYLLTRDLSGLIKEAQEIHDNAVEGNMKGQYPQGAKRYLQIAIDYAHAVLNSADSRQNDYKEACEALRYALEEFLQSVNVITGVNNLETYGLHIYTKDKEIIINNTAGSVNLSIYTMSGSVIYTEMDVQGYFTYTTPSAGIYLLVVNGTVSGSQLIIVQD